MDYKRNNFLSLFTPLALGNKKNLNFPSCLQEEESSVAGAHHTHAGLFRHGHA